MDLDIAGWVLEFLVREDSVDDRTLTKLFNVLPLPDHNLSLKKCLLFRRIESDISKGTVSETVLECLELIEELDHQEGVMEVGEAMKAAYCAVAVHCALRLLRGNIANKEKYGDVLNCIWKGRAPEMEKLLEMPMAASGMELISEELRSWMCSIKAGDWNPSGVCGNASVLKYIRAKDVVEVVRVYVAEAKEKMGPPFLQLVVEKLSDDVMKELMGVGKAPKGRQQGGIGGSEGEKAGLIANLLKRRPKRAWGGEEENALWIGVKKYGKGNWKLILNMYPDVFVGRSVVDLKDKWRNMSRYEPDIEPMTFGCG